MDEVYQDGRRRGVRASDGWLATACRTVCPGRNPFARWFVVVGVLVALLSAAISGVITALFSGVGLPFVGQLIGAVVVAPLGVMQVICLIQLARLLQNPIPPPAPPAALPGWMNPPPPQEPPGGPPVAGASPGSG